MRQKMQAPASIEESSFNKMTYQELKDLAKDRGIKGYNKMKKNELISALEGDE